MKSGSSLIQMDASSSLARRLNAFGGRFLTNNFCEISTKTFDENRPPSANRSFGRRDRPAPLGAVNSKIATGRKWPVWPFSVDQTVLYEEFIRLLLIQVLYTLSDLLAVCMGSTIRALLVVGKQPSVLTDQLLNFVIPLFI